MQSLLKKTLPFLIVGILVELSASSLSLFEANYLLFDSHSVIAAETPGEDRDITSESGTPANLEMTTQQAFAEQRKKWQQLTGEFRWDIYEILVETIFSIVGLAAVTLALLRWRPNDLSLLSFGMLCFLNGVRLNAFQFFFNVSPRFWYYWESSITYIIPVFVYLFMEQLLGKGWKSSIRLMIYVSIVFAIAAISVGIALKAPYAAMQANRFFAILIIIVIFVNMFRPGLKMTQELKVLRIGTLILGALVLHANLIGLNIFGLPLGRNIEPLGFLILIGCLGFVVIRRFFDNEKELATIARELETAKQIQSFILPQKTVDIEGLQLVAWPVISMILPEWMKNGWAFWWQMFPATASRHL
jgi:hypothetical protein